MRNWRTNPATNLWRRQTVLRHKWRQSQVLGGSWTLTSRTRPTQLPAPTFGYQSRQDTPVLEHRVLRSCQVTLQQEE